MVDKNKSAILILIILILVSLSLAGTVFYSLQKEKAKILSLQTELEDFQAKQKIVETKLQESKKTITDLGLKLQESKTQVDGLTAKLEQEKAGKLEALNQIDQLKADLEQQKSLRSDLELRLKQEQEDMEKIKTQLKQLGSKKIELEIRIKTLEAQLQKLQTQQTQAKNVELGTIVVNPEGAATVGVESEPVIEQTQKNMATSLLEGKILVVNKNYNFAVINLGSKNGVNIGDMFSVYRNDKYIGDVKIEKIHDSMSAAGFVSLDLKDKVSEGDKIIQIAK